MARLWCRPRPENCEADLVDEARAKKGPVHIAAAFEQQALIWPETVSVQTISAGEFLEQPNKR
jgi:hypothetical protein